MPGRAHLLMIFATAGIALLATRSVMALQPAATVQVVAEGVGTTYDEAIKNAFRSAVRQVVGAVVDAETLVENDELIEDKVLTYSDGFIPKWEEIPNSHKERDGLHRLKIKAEVQRRSVVVRLKAANVTVTEMDGGGMFAEAITQLDAEAGAEGLLRKAIQGFPQDLLTARTVGKPQIVEKHAERATVRFVVRVEPDLTAYKAFAARLQPVLEQIASRQGEFSAVFESAQSPRREDDFSYFSPKQTGFGGAAAAWMPLAFSERAFQPELKTDHVTLTLTTGRSASGDRLECRYYLLDKVLQPLLADIAFQRGTGKIALLDAAGEEVLVDRFPLFERVPWNTFGYEGTLISAAGMVWGQYFRVLDGGDSQREAETQKKDAFLFWISPVFFTNDFAQKPQITLSRTMSLTLNELKRVQSATCEVKFGGSAPR